MKRSRAIRLAVWCSVLPAASGCAQIAGLTDDYRLADGGAGGEAAAAGSGASGAPGGASGSSGSEAVASAGEAGSSGGEAGASGGEAGSSGGITGGGAGGAGASGTAGVSGAGAGAGAGGGSSVGPVRIGFSEFHDSAWGNDNASSHLANATFAKPAGTAPGDFILVFFGSDHALQHLSGTELDAAGWTLLDQHENYGVDGQGTYLIYKFAGANEPDPIVFSGINSTPSGNGVQGLLSVYRGVNKTSPIDGYKALVLPTGAESVTHVVTPTPAITTQAGNCLLIAGLSPDSGVDSPVITAWPDGFTENRVSVINPANPYPNAWANIYSAERHLPAAGTVPASNFGWDITSGDKYFGTLAFVLALSP